MISDSILKHSVLTSVIEGQSILAPRGTQLKRVLALDLLLTALIDAFSILVIFLLMNFSSTGEILFMSKDIVLPKAHLISALQRNPVIKIDKGQLFLEEKIITTKTITGELLDIRKKYAETNPNEKFVGAITIQADRLVQYVFLNQVILAMNQAGYSDINFAVTGK